MASASPTILVVGATGNLGRRIVEALLARKEKPTVRVALRGGISGKHVDQLRAWESCGASVVDVDLADEGNLERACSGADTVISALQGGPDVIIEGQGRLLAACQKAGVKRLVPSDFSIDLFALDEGENINLDWRRTFDNRVKASGIGYTFFLNGGFMEVMVSPYIGLIDRAAGTLSFWGDGETKIDLTSMDDAAAYLAAAILDPKTLNRVVEIVGDQLSMAKVAAAYKSTTGQTLKLVSRGPLAAGYTELEHLKVKKADQMALLPLMYQLPMVSGKARLKSVENARYPDVHPTSLAVFLKKQFVSSKA
jgi:uncharacterized protein YbjT (DUF2867 family)